MTRPPRATIDFETRSACSLKRCGNWRYSLDPSTSVLCLAYRLPHWERGRTGLWHPELPHLGMRESADLDTWLELYDWITAGELVEAHNAWFERGIWANIMRPRYDWPAIDPLQWRCSAAKAAACALPRGLEDAGAALDLSELKDEDGTKVMKKMAKPRKARKAERERWEEGEIPVLYFENRHLMEQLFAYCRQDVLAEEALSERLPDLSDDETVLYLLDQTINERGFQIDPQAVAAAKFLLAQEIKDLNAELATVTKGQVQKASQRAQLTRWFRDQGVFLDNTQAATIDATLTNFAVQYGRIPAAKACHRALEILRTLGRSSTAKYDAMVNWMSPADHRVRGGLLFHGATTGRWTGAGVQPHNFPKGGVKEKSQDRLWTVLKTRDRAQVQSAYGNTMAALSHGLRGAITATPGKQLYVADYASIEARVVLWQADDQKALDVFRNHEDIYIYMAEEIYGYRCTKEDNPKERGIGKIAVLGLGYQMGASKFQATCEKGGSPVDEDFAQKVVDAYRAKFYKVKQSWSDQEAAAIRAVRHPGSAQREGVVTWIYRQGSSFLHCQLPSGRLLAYPFPEIRQRMTPWGDMKDSLTFMGVDSYTRQWKRQVTYGGSLVENIVQAIARDIMAEAMIRCEDSEVYIPVLTVHDEIVCEAELGQGDVKAFEALVAQNPYWALDCPIEAEGWAGERYHK